MSVDSSGRPRRNGRRLTAMAAATLFALTIAPSVAAAQGGQGTRDRDMTLDGSEDFITRKADGRLTVYPHTGGFDKADPGATYRDAVTINHGWGNASWISAADVTSDGHADVLAEVNGRITVYQHSGGYAAGNPLATLGGTQPFGGAGWDNFDLKVLSDFNGDGLADIAARDRAGDLQVWPVRVENNRVVVDPALHFGTGFGYIDQMEIADLNSDGWWDLVTRENGFELVSYWGVPPAARSAAAVPAFTARGPRPAASRAAQDEPWTVIMGGWDTADMLEIKDVDLDGRHDLTGRLRAGGDVFTFRNTGTDGTVSFGEREILGAKWRGDSWFA